ncbi:MAG: hypothetical protein U0R77_14125 [Mycolicibacterium insubricum]
MSTRNVCQTAARIGGKAALAVLVAGALGAGTPAATAEVVSGSEDGWGQPPGGVMLTVDGDDGSGHHTLNLTWGNIDPLPKENGIWQCTVTERSTTTQRGMVGSAPGDIPVVNLSYTVDLLPATGGGNRRQVSAPAGELINMRLECRTYIPGAFATTPPSAPFGWHFQYQLR